MLNTPFLLKYKLPHLFFWMLIFGLWYFLRYQDYSTEAKALQVTFIKVVDLAVMISITNYILIPRLLYKKRYGWFALSFVLLVVFSSIIKMNILGRVMNSPQLYNLSGNLKLRIYDNIIPHFFLVIAGAAVKLVLDNGRLQQRMAGIAKEKAEAELSFLKSQINPHFLFNSLNSVYFLIDKENAEARNALHKFSEMLRYQLYEMNDATIPVEKEIRYLQDYVDMQKLRNDENYPVTFNYSPSVEGFSIEPLLLIPFVENAFKHISHFKDKINSINIDMKFENGVLCFTVENSKEVMDKKNEQHVGIGLNNVKRRLALLYPDRHWLEIKNDDKKFITRLKIKV
ncbi:MAG: histidine kinase [Ferruginibacter sp.]|nr:histidine kinase [Ferruginibacter sp.]